MVQRALQWNGSGLVPVLLRLLPFSQPFKELGAPQVVRPAVQAELASALQNPQRFLIPFFSLTGQRSLLPDAGHHQQQGVAVSGHLGFANGRQTGGKGLRVPVHAGDSQRLAGGRLGLLQINGSLRTEEKRAFVWSKQPIQECLVAALDELLVLVPGMVIRQALRRLEVGPAC